MIHHENKSAITPELEAEFQAAVRQAMSSRRDPEAMRRAAERVAISASGFAGARREDVSSKSSLMDAWWGLLRRDLRQPRQC